LLFAGVRFGRSAPRAPFVLGPKRISARSRAGVPARRRLSTSWMLTLRAPSLHVGAGRAFTRPVPTSDAPCRHPAPASRLLLRPPASAPCAALELTKSVSPSDQNRSTVPSLRGAISSFTRRWRNDSRRLPSCRTLCLPPQIPAAFQPRAPDASRRRTESFVVLSLLRSSTTLVHRFARTPVLRGASAARTSRLAARGSTAPRGPSRVEMSVCLPRQRIEQFATGWLALLRTALRRRAEHEPRYVRPTSASHCFDYEHSRRIRSQHLFEACASPLRPGLAPWTMETGGPGGSQRSIRFGGRRRLARDVFFRVLPMPTVPLTPPSPRRGSRSLARGETSADSAETVLCGRSVKIRPPRRSGMPSIASLPRQARVALAVESGHVRFPLRWSTGVPSPVALYSRTGDHELGARPRTLPKSGEMESVRFSAPYTVCRLLQQRQ